MISLLNSFNVPYLDYITIFPDSMLPTKFYYFRSHPKLSYDSKHKVPLIDYKLIQHSSDGADKDIDTQFGYLSMTVDLGLTEEEETQIRKSVFEMLNDPDYQENMKILYPDAYTYYEANKETDKISEKAIQISGMGVIKDGSTKFEIWEGFGKGIKRASSSEAKPSSAGNYATPLYASFDKWGAQLVAQSLKVSTDVDGKEEKAIDTTAIVRYELQVPFHVPALEAVVHVDTKDFYGFINGIIHDEKMLNGTYKGSLSTEGGVSDNFKNGVYINGGEILLSEEVISDILLKYHDTNKESVVRIRDYSALSGASEVDLKSEVLKSVLGIITNQIIPCMFEPSPISTKTGTEYAGSGSSDEDSDAVAKMVHYRLLDLEANHEFKTIHYDFSMQSMTVLPMCSSTTLLAVVPKDYVDKVITLINLESTEFNDHRVNITSPIDFAANKISTIELEVLYDEPDVRFTDKDAKGDDFVFKTGNETFGFSYFESKDKNGKFLPEFKYKTKVSYIGKGHIDQNDGWSEWMKSSVHNLLIRPETTGFISVECLMGDIDWNLIKEVDVKFTYPPALGKRDAEDTLRFKKDDAAQKSFNCYRYGSTSDEYTYEVTYLETDRTYTGPKKTSTAVQVCINDLYEGPALKANFSVNFSSTIVEKVAVLVDYEGDVETKELTENVKSWTWSKQLLQGGAETFRYKYRVFYKDTVIRETEWSEPCDKGTDIPVYTVEMRPLSATSTSIQVSAQLLALWDQFYLANVTVKYDDPDNDIHFSDGFTLDKTTLTKTVKIDNCPPNSAKPFKVSAILYDTGGNPYEVPEKECTNMCMLTKPQV